MPFPLWVLVLLAVRNKERNAFLPLPRVGTDGRALVPNQPDGFLFQSKSSWTCGAMRGISSSTECFLPHGDRRASDDVEEWTAG